MKLKLITTSDAHTLQQLRNGEDTYRWFYSQKKFSIEQVQDWIQQLDLSKERVYLIKQDDKYIGTCSIYDIDMQNKTAEIGRIIVAENMRGKGLGIQILQTAIERSWTINLDIIYANIMKDNVASQKTFEKCGFQRVSENLETGYYYELRRSIQ